MVRVEDDEVTIDLVKRFLSSHFEVDTAVTLKLAIRMTKENNYTGFLIDVNLGRGMDGYGITKMIRSIPENRSFHIVAVTAYITSGD